MGSSIPPALGGWGGGGGLLYPWGCAVGSHIEVAGKDPKDKRLQFMKIVF